MSESPRWGLTLPFAGVPLAATEPLVRRAEAAGWDDLWTGDTSGPDGFTPLALAAAWTERMRLGTGVVSAFTRGPTVLAQHAAALADASGGRCALGWGEALDPMVTAWRGGDRKQAVALAPAELLREIFVFGGPEAMRERLGEYAAGGIGTLCLMPICDAEQLPGLIDALAPV